MSGKLFENNKVKMFRSPNYNYNFSKETGYFARWGKTEEDDPKIAPMPEILDIEITSICDGGCSFCYKGNTTSGHNMSFDTFKTIIDKMPWLTQCALGADATGLSNPDMFKMMKYSRSKGIIPNLTIADVSDKVADKLASVAGAVAVSYYNTKRFDFGNACANSIKKLTDRGMKQINIHFCIHQDSFNDAMNLIDQLKIDSRFEKLNAIVFLSLKKKGRAKTGFKQLPQEKFNKLIQKAIYNKINWGCDSCSAHKTLIAIKDNENFEELQKHIEPCESSAFSSYLNEQGHFFPCSFAELTEDWETGIDVVNCKDFIKDVWMHPRVIKFRNSLLKNNRNCPIYDI